MHLQLTRLLLAHPVSFTCQTECILGLTLELCSSEHSCPKWDLGLYPVDSGALLLREAMAWGGGGGRRRPHGDLLEGELHHSTDTIRETVSRQCQCIGENTVVFPLLSDVKKNYRALQVYMACLKKVASSEGTNERVPQTGSESRVLRNRRTC